jgi:hypothetical protein
LFQELELKWQITRALKYTKINKIPYSRGGTREWLRVATATPEKIKNY